MFINYNKILKYSIQSSFFFLEKDYLCCDLLRRGKSLKEELKENMKIPDKFYLNENIT